MRGFSVLGLATLLILGLLSGLALSSDEVKDPVCGKELKASEAKFKSDYKGKTFYFCCGDCKAEFDKEPEKYAAMESSGEKMHPYPICCMLGEDIMKEVKTEMKETDKGVVVTMTSSNPEIVKKVQENIGKCKGKGEECCLMSTKNVKTMVTNIENGVKVECSSENPEVLKKLKERYGKEHKH